MAKLQTSKQSDSMEEMLHGINFKLKENFKVAITNHLNKNYLMMTSLKNRLKKFQSKSPNQ
jgi:hypothetical protein